MPRSGFFLASSRCFGFAVGVAVGVAVPAVPGTVEELPKPFGLWIEDDRSSPPSGLRGAASDRPSSSGIS